MEVIPQSPYQIQVSWQPPQTSNGIITGYEVEVFNEKHNSSQTVLVSADILSISVTNNISNLSPVLHTFNFCEGFSS